MSEAHVDIDKHVRNYILVFVALMVLTVVTVAVYYLDLSTAGAITLALIIASVKALLVALVFMHLIDEKKLVYWVLGVTFAFLLVLLLLPFLTSMADQVQSS